MAFGFVLLILPAFALAKIDVNLFGELKLNVSNLTFDVSGHEDKLISDAERVTFSLSDNNVKYAVYLHHGKRPDYAYLLSPTKPWGDFYKENGWNQVMRSLRLQSSKIVKKSAEGVAAIQRVFENKSKRKVVFSTGLYKEFENTVSSRWDKEGVISVNENINYNIDIKAYKDGGNITYSYNSPFGEKTKLSNKVLLGTTSYTEFLLNSGQSVISELNVITGNIRLQTEFVATLSGDIAVNYANKYNGKKLWNFDIEECMYNASLVNWKTSRETINIKFQTDASIVFRDYRTGIKISEYVL